MGNFIFHNLFFIYGSMRAIGAENITILYFSSSSKKRAHGKEGGAGIWVIQVAEGSRAGQ